MMNGPGPVERKPSTEPSPSDRLDSWKEIAAYLRRDESTVRRWEKDGLPVHRHLHKSRAAVFAYKSELDAWWHNDGATVDLPAPAPMLPKSARRRVWTWVALVSTALALLFFVDGRWLFGSHPRAASATTTLRPFLNLQGEFSYLALSPDGKQLAFSWASRNLPGSELFVKLVGGETPLRLTADQSHEHFAPAWSPDGRQIAYLRTSATDAGIYMISAVGGPERRLLELRPDRYYGLDWSPDGKHIAFAQRSNADEPYSLYLLSVDSLEQQRITFPAGRGGGELRFAFSPDGKSLALIHIGVPPEGGMSIQVLPSLGGATRSLYSQNEWIGDIAWSADSRSLIVTGVRHGIRRLWRLSVDDGSDEALSAAGEDAYYPSVSRQGDRLAFVREQSDSDLWRAELLTPHGPGKAPVPVTSSTRIEGAPRYSPDGAKIAYQSARSGEPEIWVSDPDGGNAIQLTLLRADDPEMPSWSPDGKTIAFSGGGAYQLISAAGGQPRELSTGFSGFNGPSWSRDGRFLYFWKDDAGQAQIWKVPVSGGHAIQVTHSGGFASAESLDGKFLYFTRRDAAGIWRMPVTGGKETLVMDQLSYRLPGYWALVEDGIYFVKTAPNSAASIEFYDFATRRSTKLLTMSGLPDDWFGGLTVSPDRRWLVFSQQQYTSSEIMLAENFR